MMDERCAQCPLLIEVEELRQRTADLEAQLRALLRQVHGPKSERQRTESPERERRRRQSEEERRAEAERRRKENEEKRKELPAREILHEVPPEERHCPKCGGTDFAPLGPGRETEIFEWIPGRLERQVHIQQTLACHCGQHIVTAAPPPKVVDKGQFGPGFIAHLVTAKCADSIPLHRLETQFKRSGVPVARSTMTDLFHAAADLLRPLRDRLLALIASMAVVLADETKIKVQDAKKTRTAWMWTFLGRLALGAAEVELIAYRYSASRSGQTPSAVLGATTGTLVVDAYTGYNAVCTPEKRERASCWAHCRRKFFEALPSAPEAQHAIDILADLYGVEHEALERKIVRQPAHRALREHKSAPVLERFRLWLESQQPQHPPRSPLGKAISYAQNQWTSLQVFLKDENVPLDNNLSEGALRVVALGRKNFLFVGHDEAGDNLAVLYSLVASCTAAGVVPEVYLADVLLRVQTHPQARIDDLLPHKWKRLFGPDAQSPQA
jgi:transposase